MTKPHLPLLLGDDFPLPRHLPFTPAMAERSGVPRRTLARLLASGHVYRITRGVYAAAQAEATLEFRAAAVGLVATPGAVLTDETAAWLHGLDLLPASRDSLLPPVQVFCAPGGNRSKRPGTASGERMLHPRDICVVHGLRVTTPLRTACDLGRLQRGGRALAALDQFLRLGVDHDELLLEIDRFKGYRGVIQLRALAPLADPRSESVGESVMRFEWYGAGMPTPELQWWLYDDAGVGVYRLDLALPEVRFAAEYDGEEFHTSEADRAHDLERREWIAGRAWHVEVLTKFDLFDRRGYPGTRFHEGLLAARRALASPTSYPTLR